MTSKKAESAKNRGNSFKALPLPVQMHLVHHFGEEGGQLYVPKSVPGIDKPKRDAFIRDVHEHGYSVSKIAKVFRLDPRYIRRLKAETSRSGGHLPPGVDSPEAGEHYLAMMLAWVQVVAYDALIRSRLDEETVAHPVRLLMDAEIIRDRCRKQTP